MEFPAESAEIVRSIGDQAFQFRHGQPVRVGDVMALLPSRRYQVREEVVAAIVGVLDERRGADRRMAPPRFGRLDAR
jgi:hypothetical protein